MSAAADLLQPTIKAISTALDLDDDYFEGFSEATMEILLKAWAEEGYAVVDIATAQAAKPSPRALDALHDLNYRLRTAHGVLREEIVISGEIPTAIRTLGGNDFVVFDASLDLPNMPIHEWLDQCTEAVSGG